MNAQIPEKYKILNAAALKWIAIITMLIDHSAKALLYNCVIKPNIPLTKGTSLYSVYRFYRVLRGIGRLAFPIFCFFLIEGFLHTRNRKKYLIRLTIFGVLSELPFDLGLSGQLYYPGHQNVMFEMALGLIMIWIWDELQSIEKLNSFFRTILQVGSAALLMNLAQMLKLDYGYKGLGLILILYLTRFERITQCVCTAIYISLWEWQAVFAFPLLALYNGKRGHQHKYFFYAFYPVHLLILFILAKMLSGTP